MLGGMVRTLSLMNSDTQVHENRALPGLIYAKQIVSY